MHNPEQEQSKTKSEKTKDAYNWAEEKATNKFTVASILFAIIGPLLLKILEALAMIIWVVPFHEQLTVYINLILLLSILVGMFAVLYGFHEWKLRIDIKRSKFVDRNSLENQLKREFENLNKTVEDKAKENVMSNSVLITAITKPPEERKKMQEFINTIDYSPNGIDNMDTDEMRELWRKMAVEIQKQEVENAQKEDIIQSENEEFLHTGDEVNETKDQVVSYGKITASKIEDITQVKKAIKEVAADREAELEKQLAEVDQKSEIILVDESGNRYTLNPDGKSRKYI